MKKLIALAVSMLILGIGISPVVKAQVEEVGIRVDGLSCPFCAYGVEKKVGGLDGVEKVEIEIEDGLVAVTLADGATLDEATAKQAIDEAGFTLRSFEAPKK